MAWSHSVTVLSGAHDGATKSLSMSRPLLPPVRSFTSSRRMIDGNTAATANVNSPRYSPWMRRAGSPKITPNKNSPGTTTPRVDKYDQWNSFTSTAVRYAPDPTKKLWPKESCPL